MCLLTDELTTSQIYTTELIDGIPVDQCADLDQETRDRISHLLLDLFFRELFEFRFMQTDANWSNFLYNVETKQVSITGPCIVNSIAIATVVYLSLLLVFLDWTA